MKIKPTTQSKTQRPGPGPVTGIREGHQTFGSIKTALGKEREVTESRLFSHWRSMRTVTCTSPIVSTAMIMITISRQFYRGYFTSIIVI